MRLLRNSDLINAKTLRLVALLLRVSLEVSVSVHQLVLSWLLILSLSSWMSQPLVSTPLLQPQLLKPLENWQTAEELSSVQFISQTLISTRSLIAWCFLRKEKLSISMRQDWLSTILEPLEINIDVLSYLTLQITSWVLWALKVKKLLKISRIKINWPKLKFKKSTQRGFNISMKAMRSQLWRMIIRLWIQKLSLLTTKMYKKITYPGSTNLDFFWEETSSILYVYLRHLMWNLLSP